MIVFVISAGDGVLWRRISDRSC